MKQNKIIIALILAICMAITAFAIVGCSQADNRDPQIKAVYEAYVSATEATGEDPLSYEQWLESIKGVNGIDGVDGKDGKDGKDGNGWITGEGVPQDTVGKNGDIYLDVSTFDIYLKSEGSWGEPIGNIKGATGAQGPQGNTGAQGGIGPQGSAGKSAYDLWKENNSESELSESEWLESLNGATWHVGAEKPADDFGKVGDLFFNTQTREIYRKYPGSVNCWISLTQIKDGQNGENGKDGKDGNQWFADGTDPDSSAKTAQSKEGDMYLDTKTWNVYQKQGGFWQLLGCLASGASSGPVEPEGITITPEEPYTYTTRKSPNLYILTVELSAQPTVDTIFRAVIGKTTSRLVKSSTRSNDGKTVYYGFIDITNDANTDTEIELKSEGGNVVIVNEDSIKIEEMSEITIQKGVPVEIPVFPSITGALKYHIALDETLGMFEDCRFTAQDESNQQQNVTFISKTAESDYVENGVTTGAISVYGEEDINSLPTTQGFMNFEQGIKLGFYTTHSSNEIYPIIITLAVIEY